jgi:hypothetical protein
MESEGVGKPTVKKSFANLVEQSTGSEWLSHVKPAPLANVGSNPTRLHQSSEPKTFRVYKLSPVSIIQVSA